MNNDQIKLNEVLHISPAENLKIRMLTKYSKLVDPLNFFKNGSSAELMDMLLWNYSRKSFREGDLVIGLLRLRGDHWLLFNICEITKDLGVFDGPSYEYQIVEKYRKFFGRIVVSYKNKAQTLIRRADSMLEECSIYKILEDKYEDEEFPGYENVNIDWLTMRRVIDKSSWRTALQNQKAVYLITDDSNGKMYVGSARGQNMLLGRWMDYLRTGHGGNEDLKNFDLKYISDNFRYSVLEVFKSTVSDALILEREAWWKNVLATRQFGYNRN